MCMCKCIGGLKERRVEGNKRNGFLEVSARDITTAATQKGRGLLLILCGTQRL